MRTCNSKLAFSIAAVNSAVMLLGMAVGFLWKWEPNIGLELMGAFMVLAVVTVAFQLVFVRPRLELQQWSRAAWILLVLAPVFGIAYLLFLCGALYVMISIFQEYIKNHGI